MTNGCKPSYFPKYLNFNFCFKDACKWHDEQYSTGGDEEKRENVDYEFYSMMIEIANKKSFFKKLFCKQIARLFYKLVDIKGSSSWNYN